jgi:hypothetical protein
MLSKKTEVGRQKETLGEPTQGLFFVLFFLLSSSFWLLFNIILIIFEKG